MAISMLFSEKYSELTISFLSIGVVIIEYIKIIIEIIVTSFMYEIIKIK